LELTADPRRRDCGLDSLARVPIDRVDRVAFGLTHPLVTVRRLTIEALIRMKHTEASVRVRTALTDADPVVRESAVVALGRIGASDVSARLAKMAAGDSDAAVRRAAAAALSRQTDPGGGGGAGG
jgi:HEAT repeat protein